MESFRAVCELVKKVIDVEFASAKVGEALRGRVLKISALFDPPKVSGERTKDLDEAVKTMINGIESIRTLLAEHSKLLWFSRVLKKQQAAHKGNEDNETMASFVKNVQFSLLALQLLALLQQQREGDADVEGDRTLLWVDDYPEDNKEEAKVGKEKHGLTVIQAKSTKEAKEYLTANSEKLKKLPPSRFRIITDLHRDDEGDDAGKHFMEWLRSDPGWNNTPVLIYCRRNEAGIPLQRKLDNVLLATKQGQLYLYFSTMSERSKRAGEKHKPARAHKKRGRKEEDSDTEENQEDKPKAKVKHVENKEKEDDKVVIAAAAAPPIVDGVGVEEFEGLPPPSPQIPEKKEEKAKTEEKKPPQQQPKLSPVTFIISSIDSVINVDGPIDSGFNISIKQEPNTLPPKWENLLIAWKIKGENDVKTSKIDPAQVVKDCLHVNLRKIGMSLTGAPCVYEFSVLNDGKEICPTFDIKTVPGKLSTLNSEIIAPPEIIDIEAGTEAIFRISLRDSVGNKISLNKSLTLAIIGPDELHGDLKENELGLCTCTIPMKKVGKYTVEVKTSIDHEGENQIKGSPIKITVRPSVISGIEVKGIEPGQTFSAGQSFPDLRLLFRDRFNNEVSGEQKFVISARKDGAETKIRVGEISRNPLTGHTIVKKITIMPKESGAHVLSIGIVGGPSKLIPINMNPGTIDPLHCEVSGQCLNSGSCNLGQLSTLQVAVKDSCGLSVNYKTNTDHLLFKCEGPVYIPALIRETDSNIAITFFPTLVGKYKISILINDKQLPRTPFDIIVKDENSNEPQAPIPAPIKDKEKDKRKEKEKEDKLSDSESTQPDDFKPPSPKKKAVVKNKTDDDDDADTEPDASPEIKPKSDDILIAPPKPKVGDDYCAPTLRLDTLEEEETEEKETQQPVAKKTPAKMAASGIDLPALPLGD